MGNIHNPLPSWQCTQKKEAQSHGRSHSQGLQPSLSHSDVKNPSFLFSLSSLPSKSDPKDCLCAETQPDPLCPKCPCALRQPCCHPGAPSQQSHHPPNPQETHGRVRLHGRHHWGQKRGQSPLSRGFREESHGILPLAILNVDFESHLQACLWLDISVQLAPWLVCGHWRYRTSSDHTPHCPCQGSQRMGGKGGPRGQQPSRAQPSMEQHKAWTRTCVSDPHIIHKTKNIICNGC